MPEDVESESETAHPRFSEEGPHDLTGVGSYARAIPDRRRHVHESLHDTHRMGLEGQPGSAEEDNRVLFREESR